MGEVSGWVSGMVGGWMVLVSCVFVSGVLASVGGCFREFVVGV